MTNINFKGRVSKQGDRLVIIIPKPLHEMISPIKGKDVLIELKEIEVQVKKMKLGES